MDFVRECESEGRAQSTIIETNGETNQNIFLQSFSKIMNENIFLQSISTKNPSRPKVEKEGTTMDNTL